MTDARAARPPDGDIARFRKFQNASEKRVPGNGQPASRKRDLRSNARSPRRDMRAEPGDRSNAGSNGVTRAKDLGMDLSRLRAAFAETRGETVQKRLRPA
jgi:hypothetical protein